MTVDSLRRVMFFLALCLAQVLVFNHIHLFGFAMILLYVYFVIRLPLNFPRWANLLCSFSLGLVIDIFTNTPGMAAGALTLTGFLQSYLLPLFVPRESPENLVPSWTTLGFSKFLTYAAMLVSVYCLAFFSIELFCFFNPLHWLLSIVGSTLLTLLLIVALESIRK